MDVYMALIHGYEVLPLASGDNPPTSIRLPKSHEVNETEFFVYVPERTCHDQFDGKAWCFRCDNCGCVIPWKDSFNNKSIRAGLLNYCPNCGAKVVEE